jgi:hypothetical protein
LRTRLRKTAALAAAAALATLTLAGCAGGDDWSGPHAAPSPLGVLGAGFVNPSAPPAPESTVTPEADSWDRTGPSKGYRVVLLSAGDDKTTGTLVAAVRDWADDEDVSLRTVEAEGAHDLLPSITRAMDLDPDLIVTAGNDLVDPLALVTANHLDQPFLILGAEVAEPTHNVTAVGWQGASFRGEGLGMASSYDAASFTAKRAARAIRAGVAAVLHDVTGIVVWIS